jgi:hypothetical protein
MLGVQYSQLKEAVGIVNSGYPNGSVAIQEDITESMQYSGVVYTNLNGRMEISIGPKDFVHDIVKGILPPTRVSINNNIEVMGEPVAQSLIKSICEECSKAEAYFGTPLDIEFAFTNEGFVFLQARPLPAPTDKAIKALELRRAKSVLSNTYSLGVDDIPLGIGNYREILGDSKATELSISVFNYIFSGDGKSIMGAVQLGRTALGYDVGKEAFPWVISLGGKVYYNFIADSLQFRPQGVSLERYIKLINKHYIPELKTAPEKLNYPELGLYIQFQNEAIAAGLDPEPFAKVVESNRKAVSSINVPNESPSGVSIEIPSSAKECIAMIKDTADMIRKGSAKDYVIAARLAFFAMEDVRNYLAETSEKNPAAYGKLCTEFSAKGIEKLRNAILYDESIRSFELEPTENNRYIGSFELSTERDFPPKRRYKSGRGIDDKKLAALVGSARTALENREKVKFYLFRDYNSLRQAVLHLAELSGIGDNMFGLRLEELDLVNEKPMLAEYRYMLRKSIKPRGDAIFSDPLFLNSAESLIKAKASPKTELVFGTLNDGEHKFIDKSYIAMIKEVDQTKAFPEELTLVIVQDNIRPGSHIFTQLSDYGVPVISMNKELFDAVAESNGFTIKKTGESIEIVCN